jgi:hypothetical protein
VRAVPWASARHRFWSVLGSRVGGWVGCPWTRGSERSGAACLTGSARPGPFALETSGKNGGNFGTSRGGAAGLGRA